MKDIRIKALVLTNFKCHKALTLDFDGRSASIYGDNATGKTSVYDALTWLLFGKDSLGNGEKNVEIKPLGADGDVRDHLAETAVEAVLLTSEGEVTLRRTLREVWTQKRGSTEATYDGNTSEYFVDGVPVKKYAFQERVGALVSEETFRMLTSVTHFASQIPWQERRATLFRLSGIEDDRAIMATNDAFTPLLDEMGRLSVDDLKKKLQAEKRKHVGVKNDLPARIDECEKTVAEICEIDFDAARETLGRLETRKEELDREILAVEEDAAIRGKEMEIREVRLELATLESENRAFRARQESGTVDVGELKRQVGLLERDKKNAEGTKETLLSTVKSLDGRIAASRERWISVYRETFTGGACPTCGQMLPADQLREAQERFETGKKERLREIEATANALKESKKGAEERIAEILLEVDERTKEISAKNEEIRAAEANRIEILDMGGYRDRRDAINARLGALEGELAEMSEAGSAVRERLTEERRKILSEITAARQVLGKESLLAYSRERIEALRTDARNTAAVLERVEMLLYLLEEYARYKTQYVEDSINGLFRIARFRLFREQANGGVEDRCDVVYDGIPYGSLNSGMRINVGVDIINTLSRAYGVTVPLFIDNAESVTRLEGSDAQIVRLVVSESDKELRVRYEN